MGDPDLVGAQIAHFRIAEKLGQGGMGVTGAKTVGSLVAPGDAEAYHFCGHIYTTDSCPHPTGLPRIDSKGLPLKASNGRPVDDLGRYVDINGAPVDDFGAPLTDGDGAPLPKTTRTALCTAMCELVAAHGEEKAALVAARLADRTAAGEFSVSRRQ